MAHPNRRFPRRGWLALIVLALLLAGAAMLVAAIPGMIRGFMNGSPSNVSADDPMFAEPPEIVTRPPSLSGEESIFTDGADDPSRNWRYETLTPLTSDGFAAL
ncbi:MAG: hypothetical protein ACSW8J_01330 [bacterium]